MMKADGGQRFPFSVIGKYGQVHSTGVSNMPSHAEGKEVLDLQAPADHYWDGSQFLPIGEQPSPWHVYDWPTHRWIDRRSLDDLKGHQLALIDAGFEREAEGLVAGYPASERLTWPVQQAEALAWGADAAAPTPFLDGVATARGLDPATMRRKTLDMVTEYLTRSQALVGRRQALRDEVLAAKRSEDIAAITWVVDPP